MVADTELIHRWRNGNYWVNVCSDGSLTREAKHKGKLKPKFPEAFDIKITNYCDGGCPWCHEGSTVKGKHSKRLLSWGDGPFERGEWENIRGNLPQGVEIAIGGGNPLDHPEIVPWVKLLREQGYVPNMTMNSRHAISHKAKLEEVRPYLYGLGVSYNPYHIDRINDISDENTVTHFILGVHDVREIKHAMSRLQSKKFLILGYKDIRFGSSYRLDSDYGESDVDRNLEQAVDQMRSLMVYEQKWLLKMNALISFDTLALKQLGVRNYAPPEVWNEGYMGEDGEFTFFVDLVANQYAMSSSAKKRYTTYGRTIPEMFEDLQYEMLRAESGH